MSSRLHQRRNPLSVGTELLESRRLLNAHMPHHATPHAAKGVAGQISGMLAGQAVYVQTSPESAQPVLGSDTYDTRGTVAHKPATFTARDQCSSTNISGSKYRDVYSQGTATLTLSDGSSFKVSYSGSGHSSTKTPKYDASFRGTAVGASGAIEGHLYSFKETIVGNSKTNKSTMKVVLKG